MKILWMTLLASFGLIAAEASTYGTLYSIEEMTDLAHDVISGTVTKLESKQMDGVIKTSVTVSIEHNFVGSKSQSFTFDVIGGTINGITMDVPGAPKFEEGQSVLLFPGSQASGGFRTRMYAIGPDKTATRVHGRSHYRLDESTPAPNTLI